jgi:hypothetical protein
MVAIIRALPTHQPGSHTYEAMTAVSYLAGLRPGEVVMLRPRALTLPNEEGEWGLVAVVESDIDFDERGEPKIGNRWPPNPPELMGSSARGSPRTKSP